MSSLLYSNNVLNQFNESYSFQTSLQFRKNKKILNLKRNRNSNQQNRKSAFQNLIGLPKMQKKFIIDDFKMHISNPNIQIGSKLPNQFFTVRKKQRSRSKAFKKQLGSCLLNKNLDTTLKLSFRNKSVQNLLKRAIHQKSQFNRQSNYGHSKAPKKFCNGKIFQIKNDLQKTKTKSYKVLEDPAEQKKQPSQAFNFFSSQEFSLKSNISMVQSIIFNQKKQIQLSDLHIIKQIGKGEYGKVYMAIHKATYFIFALKIISKQKVKDHKYQQQILRELKIHSSLDHPNIIPMYGFFDDCQNIYVLMEFCLGKNLNIFTQQKQCLRMQQSELSQIALQLTDGIQYLHRRNIIHRDIKPENIMLSYGVPKICDFGWSIHKNTSDLTNTRSGTPLYYPPQIVKGESYDYKVDIWAFGMILYECLVGKTPFKVYTQSQLNRIVDCPLQFPDYVEINRQTKNMIHLLLQKKPTRRIGLQDVRNSQFINKYRKKYHQSQYYIDLFFALRK